MLVGTVATALISVPMSSRAEGGDARVGEVRDDLGAGERHVPRQADSCLPPSGLKRLPPSLSPGSSQRGGVEADTRGWRFLRHAPGGDREAQDQVRCTLQMTARAPQQVQI